MTIKKQLIAIAAAAVLAAPAAAQTVTPANALVIQNPVAILIGLLLPAVQKVREAAR